MRIDECFKEMIEWTREIPLQDMALQRFGNLAFRDWHQRLEQEAVRLVSGILGETGATAALPHLLPYFLGGFGDKTRIDYGSGHEVSFIAFLAGLDLLGLVQEPDYPIIVLDVFDRYISN